MQNPDGTYDFESQVNDHPKKARFRMEYEIIGSDSLYLVEMPESNSDNQHNPRQMLLHISWDKKGKNKSLKMAGAWYNSQDAKKQGDVVLYQSVLNKAN